MMNVKGPYLSVEKNSDDTWLFESLSQVYTVHMTEHRGGTTEPLCSLD